MNFMICFFFEKFVRQRHIDRYRLSYLVRSLPKACVSQPLNVDVLHLPLELLEAPGKVRAEAVLDVVADLEVGRPPLDVVFMCGLKIVDRVAYLEIDMIR